MTTDPVYKRDQVIGIINTVLTKIQMPANTSATTLSQDLIELKDIIENLRTQLHATQVSDIGNMHIPSATDELDAVVSMTETATNDIMASCENILELTQNERPELFSQIEQNVVKVFEACTFQDITGQRIKKVTSCLKQIEDKTNNILEALEISQSIPAVKAPALSEEDSLLNGPALPQNAISQDDIDKLLAELD